MIANRDRQSLFGLILANYKTVKMRFDIAWQEIKFEDIVNIWILKIFLFAFRLISKRGGLPPSESKRPFS